MMASTQKGSGSSKTKHLVRKLGKYKIIFKNIILQKPKSCLNAPIFVFHCWMGKKDCVTELI